MSFEAAIAVFVSVLPAQIPVLVLLAVGLYLAMSRREVAPRAFKSAAWGFSLLIVHSLAGTALQVAMLRIRMNMPSRGVAEALFWPGIMSAAAQLLFIAGLVLVTRAVFLDRKAKKASNPEVAMPFVPSTVTPGLPGS
jgi:hypothetical protein